MAESESIPLLQQHQPLLRQFAASVVDGVSDTRAAPHIQQVFQSLFGSSYLGLEVVLVEAKGAIAIFQHDKCACGSLYVPPVVDPNTRLARNCPIGIRAPSYHRHASLLRVPLLCDQHTTSALLHASTPDIVYDVWLDHARHAPTIGSLLLATPTNTTSISRQLDCYTANALVFSAYMAPMLIQHAHQRLLQAALSAKVVSTTPSNIVYQPGMGFVPVQDGSSKPEDIASHLLHLLNEEQHGDFLQHVLLAVQGHQHADSDQDSSSGSMDSVNKGCVEGKGETGEEESPSTSREGVKRQRCADDAHSWARGGWDDDDDDDGDDVLGGRDDSMGGPTSTVAQETSAQETGGGSTEGPRGGPRGGQTHKTRAPPQRLEDGLQYADADIEGRFMVFMHQDIALVKRCVMWCFFLALAWRCWNVLGSNAPWDVQTMAAVAMFNAGTMAVLQCIPIRHARWAHVKERAVFALFVVLGVPNAVLQTRHCLEQLCKTPWARMQATLRTSEGLAMVVVVLMMLLCSAARNRLARAIVALTVVVASCAVVLARDQPVADSKQWLSRTLPILSVLSFLSNGATLRLIRHTWAQRVSRAKHTAMLAYLAIAAFINPALPAWALAGVALVAQVMVNLTSFGQVLEAQQRLQFERTAL